MAKRAVAAKSTPPEAVLYAIKLGPNVYKIGFSKNQGNRVKSGQTFYGDKLSTLCAVPVADPRLAEKQCLLLLGSRGRAGGHEVVHKSEEDVINAIHLVTGKERLTPAQVGDRLWNTEVQGKTVGEWAIEAWALDHQDPMAARRSLAFKALESIGFTPDTLDDDILHLHNPEVLLRALPEFGLWTSTVNELLRFEEDGEPVFNKKRTAVKLSVVKKD